MPVPELVQLFKLNYNFYPKYTHPHSDNCVYIFECASIMQFKSCDLQRAGNLQRKASTQRTHDSRLCAPMCKSRSGISE